MTRRPKGEAAGAAAIEISPRTAKAMVATPGPLQVQRVQAVTLPDPSEDPTAPLRKLLEAHPLGLREAGLVLGREAFSLRTLELPSVAPKEIASMLELQLGKLTPYPRGEILSGWTTVGTFREGYTSVLLAVSRKTLVEGALALLHAKGISPRWVSVSSEGLERWWTHVAKFGGAAPSGQLTAVIDIDVASTDCAILSDGRLLFSHSIALGAEQLRGGEAAQLRWVGELIRLPRVLLHEDIKGQIGRGVLTGLTESLGLLADQLAGQWGVPVEVVEPLAAAAISPAVRTLTQAHPAAYTALAGCLATATPPRIDLLPPETRVSQGLQVRSRHLARLAASLIALLVFAGVLYVERIIILQGYVAQLRDRLSSVERTSEQVIQHREAMQRINRWLDPSRSALEVVRAVAEAVDPGITVTHLTFAEGDPVVLRGRAAAIPAAYTFFDRLKAQGLFASVHARSVAKSRGADATTADFELVCELPAT